MIPKHYYCYWHSKIRPPFVQACMNRYQELNPGWTGHLLSQVDMDKIPKPKNFENLKSRAHKADWLRCYIMATRGGVWLDASIVMLKALEAWVDVNFNGLQGFWLGDSFENWAFAVPKDCPFMHAWCDEFKKAIKMGFENYKNLPSIQASAKRQAKLPYLTMHLCWRVVREQLPSYPIKATSAISKTGPYAIHAKGHWFFPFFVFRLLAYPTSSIDPRIPFIKIRALERKFVSSCLSVGLYSPSSVFVQGLGVSTPPFHFGFFLILLILIILVLILFCVFVSKR